MGLIKLVFRVIFRLGLKLLLPVFLLGVGWYGGAKYGAPDLLIRAADGVVARGQLVLEPILGKSAEVAGDVVSEGVERGGELAADAVEQGGDYVVGTVELMLEDLAEEPAAPQEGEEADTPAQSQTSETEAPKPAAASTSVVSADGDIVLCPKMNVTNAPRSNSDRMVKRAGANVSYKGVNLLLMPATKSCLSSGYGNRNGRLHKGIDYHTQQSGDVLAAGDGVIVQAVSRKDYGNMIVIDHGNNVYTLYGHLARFGSGVRKGASVSQGQVLGPIGTTGSSSVIHLHWEVLSGEWNDAAGPFGLNPVNPFAL